MTFDFTQDYILENDYVLLRPLQSSDIAHLLTYALNQPELWTYSLVQANSEERLKHYINLALIARENKTAYPFIVFDKVNQQYAGSTRFYDIQLESDSLQLGYTWYGKTFQRTGLNRHCKNLMLTFAFDTINMARVEFRADNDNVKSIEAMKQLGCTVEGILRENTYRADGSRRDSIVLSILKHEWQFTIKAQLQQRCKPILAFN